MTPDPNNPSWIWDRLDRMEDLTSEQHQRLRSDMIGNSNQLRDELKKDLNQVSIKLSSIEVDVLTIKTERRMEAQRTSRNIALYSVYSGLAMALILEVFRFFIHRP